MAWTSAGPQAVRRGADFRRRYAIPPDCVLVVQAGTMRQEKGVPDLLQAALSVVAAGADVHFLLAGDGPKREEFERLAEQLGISSRVTFSGRIRDPLGEGLWRRATSPARFRGGRKPSD